MCNHYNEYKNDCFHINNRFEPEENGCTINRHKFHLGVLPGGNVNSIHTRQVQRLETKRGSVTRNVL